MSSYKLLTTADDGEKYVFDKLDKKRLLRIESSQSVHSKYMKWASLAVLTLQTTSLIILFSYSRVSPTGGTLYLSSSVVVIAEILKLIFCYCTILRDSGSITTSFRIINQQIICQPQETLKALVPAFLYAIQNNLAFYALKNLDPATYQVAYQLKILTTATFSVMLVNKKIKGIQWIALILLFAGVSLAQLPNDADQANFNVQSDNRNRFLGLSAVVVCCLSSGFSGVYFERLIKMKPTQSIWIRNLQLAFFCLIISIATMLSQDWAQINQNGLLQGYTTVTWIIVFLQAFGGLVVATVVKFADNILKGFATSISIVLSTVLSFYLFENFNPAWNFYCGASMVISATIMYSL